MPAINEITVLNITNITTKNITDNILPNNIFQRLNGLIASSLIVPVSNS